MEFPQHLHKFKLQGFAKNKENYQRRVLVEQLRNFKETHFWDATRLETHLFKTGQY